MKKFLVLYMASNEAMDKMANANPEEQKAGMEPWVAWMEKNKANFVEMGGPLGKNTRVTKDGASQERNEIGGYSIMQAESADEVAKMLADSPNHEMEGSRIEVMEILPM